MLSGDGLFCDNCGTRVFLWKGRERMNSPMIKNDLWEKISNYFGMSPSKEYAIICDNCMEKALKRKLCISDLKPCPLSDDWAEVNITMKIKKEN